jgi:hypothetical protein
VVVGHPFHFPITHLDVDLAFMRRHGDAADKLDARQRIFQ